MSSFNLTGRTLGNYQIIEELGRGGMAIVYRAYQPSLNRGVAIKVLPPHFTFDAQFVERFQREAKAAASLNHPHIVTIHDVAEQDGLHYIVMELLEGQTLRQLIEREGALPPQRVVGLIAQVASALDYAHQRGFIHRDVKPSNVFVGLGDRVTLTDFGIVKAASGTQLTQTGMLIGTPEYMSPEQAQGEEASPRSDEYALGVVAYQMLCGQVPFGGTTPHAVLYKQINEPPPPLSSVRPGLPAALDAVLLAALAKNPAGRYPSAGAFAQALAQANGGGAALAGIGGVAGSGATTLVGQPPNEEHRGPPVWLWALTGATVIVVIVSLVLLIRTCSPASDSAATAEALAHLWQTQTAQARPTEPEPTATLAPTFTATPSPEEPPVATTEPAITETAPPTSTGTSSATPTGTASATPTETATGTPTSTPTASPSATASPTKTPTFTASPTRSPSRTPTATHTPARTSTPAHTPTYTPLPPEPPPGLSLVLDDFEGHGSNASLQSIYGVNTAWGKNVGQLTLAGPPNIGSGNQSAAFYYEIKNAAPDDYAGFERSFPAQNWQGHSAFHVWIKSDGSNKDFLIQLRETSGEVYRYRTNFSTFGVKDFDLPLNTGTFQWADWSTWQNGQIDLHAIEYYGFFIGNGGLGSGTIYVDEIGLK